MNDLLIANTSVWALTSLAATSLISTTNFEKKFDLYVDIETRIVSQGDEDTEPPSRPWQETDSLDAMNPQAKDEHRRFLDSVNVLRLNTCVPETVVYGRSNSGY